jgi:sulfide dehydrogenase cytochrome subunit
MIRLFWIGIALLGFAGAQAQDNGLAARSLAATCANCHGTNGQARAEMPPLAGRPAAEIVTAFNDFKSGARPATVMHQIAKGYTDEQVRLLAGWFAAQPAR